MEGARNDVEDATIIRRRKPQKSGKSVRDRYADLMRKHSE
jgi:hypothetical protein